MAACTEAVLVEMTAFGRPPAAMETGFPLKASAWNLKCGDVEKGRGKGREEEETECEGVFRGESAEIEVEWVAGAATVLGWALCEERAERCGQ